MTQDIIATLRQEARHTLENNILPFWNEMADDRRGGFYGRRDGQGVLHPDAEKGAVLNARILWSYSAAYRVIGGDRNLQMADRARDYILQHFIDTTHGGVFWSLNADGTPLDTKKQSYAIGFMIYAFSEYALATGDENAKQTAISLYRTLEAHAFDPVSGGYIEALTRDWQPIDDMRLSDFDENASRTQNTHLHIIEPYTALYRVWPDPALRRAIVRLLHIFIDRLRNPLHNHIDLFFDEQWRGRRDIQSFGHDIEASWLLHESALVLEEQENKQNPAEATTPTEDPSAREILRWLEPHIRAIASASRRGLLPNGAMRHEARLDGTTADNDLHWWVQCENIIGHLNLYQHFHDEAALRIAHDCWQWTTQNLIDHTHGEWHWSVRADGTLNRTDDKAGFWKCPYHNTRLCTEILTRFP